MLLMRNRKWSFPARWLEHSPINPSMLWAISSDKRIDRRQYPEPCVVQSCARRPGDPEYLAITTYPSPPVPPTEPQRTLVIARAFIIVLLLALHAPTSFTSLPTPPLFPSGTLGTRKLLVGVWWLGDGGGWVTTVYVFNREAGNQATAPWRLTSSLMYLPRKTTDALPYSSSAAAAFTFTFTLSPSTSFGAVKPAWFSTFPF